MSSGRKVAGITTLALFGIIWGVDAVLYLTGQWTISEFMLEASHSWPFLISSTVSFFFGFISGHFLWPLIPKSVRQK